LGVPYHTQKNHVGLKGFKQCIYIHTYIHTYICTHAYQWMFLTGCLFQYLRGNLLAKACLKNPLITSVYVPMYIHMVTESRKHKKSVS
jgi:hypothetical protein